jgi:hypothetical protein
MSDMRKITAFIPAELLATAQSYTGAGVTETLRLALENLNRAEWSTKMLALRGTWNADLDLDELRADREFGEDGTPL